MSFNDSNLSVSKLQTATVYGHSTFQSCCLSIFPFYFKRRESTLYPAGLTAEECKIILIVTAISGPGPFILCCWDISPQLCTMITHTHTDRHTPTHSLQASVKQTSCWLDSLEEFSETPEREYSPATAAYCGIPHSSHLPLTTLTELTSPKHQCSILPLQIDIHGSYNYFLCWFSLTQ
jgi:hypothetical protein